MATNKKTSQLPNKATPDISDIFRYGNDYNISWAQILSALGLMTNQTLTIAYNNSNTIQLFNTGAFGKTTIDYYIRRGTRYRIEQLQVMSDGINVKFLSSGIKTIPDNNIETTGITITGNVIRGIVVLTITADNSDTNNALMIYKVIFQG